MKKLITALSALALLSLCAITANAQMFTPSDWAKDSFDAMISMGAMPEELFTKDYTSHITRAEFATLIYDAYTAHSGKEYAAFAKHKFNDMDYSGNTLASIYELGIMKGDENNNFNPDNNISRQETAVVINNFYTALTNNSLTPDINVLYNFADYYNIADWSMNAVSAVVSQGFMGDYGDGDFHPFDDVTIEQAVSMISRMITAPRIERPVITSHSNGGTFDVNSPALQWTGNSSLGEYIIGIFDGTTVGYMFPEQGNEVMLSTLEENRTYYLWVEQNAVFSEPIQVFTGNPFLEARASYDGGYLTIAWDGSGSEYTVTVTESRTHRSSGRISPHTSAYTTSDSYLLLPSAPSRSYDITVNNGMLSDNIQFSTPSAVSNYSGNTYLPSSQSEAASVMTNVEINIWKMDRSGNKYPSTTTLTVHSSIADEVYAVFQEIFEGAEQFPIESVGAYSWRGGRSEHNWGTAIDINPTQNYCIYTSGEIVGDFWLPYENPYSITPYGDVMNAFENHGFTWGGDAWSGNIDYMHFSYFGT
ncbi:MAG: M15 family metallopeptidase [Oscillospiraceae bacterium]|nr:M15 family metallopeptidase [Oscillospiraceae bacterium]